MFFSIECQVICIHGCFGSTSEYDPLRLALLNKGIPSLAVPLLGHPGHPAGMRFFQVSAEAIVDDLLTQLLALDMSRPTIIMGHSLGGLLGLGHVPALLEKGKQVMGIATLGTPFDTAWSVNQPLGWLTRRSVPHLFKAVTFVPDSMKTLSEPMALIKSIKNYRRLRSETEWMFGWMQAQLDKVSIPVHLIHGHYDLTVPREALNKLKNGLTASPLITVSNLNNFGHQIYPSSRASHAVTQDLLSFVHSVLSYQNTFISP